MAIHQQDVIRKLEIIFLFNVAGGGLSCRSFSFASFLRLILASTITFRVACASRIAFLV